MKPPVETRKINKIRFRECLKNECVSTKRLGDLVDRSPATINNYIAKGLIPIAWTSPIKYAYGIEPKEYLLSSNKMREPRLYLVNRRKFFKAIRAAGYNYESLAESLERSPDTITRYLRRGSFPSKWLTWIKTITGVPYQDYSGEGKANNAKSSMPKSNRDHTSKCIKTR